MGKKKENNTFIILLGSLYYFIGLYVKIKIGSRRVVKWVGKIDKVVFEDAIYLFIYLFIFCILGC